MQGKVAEKYVYDPAGNILSKTIDGKTTTFTYDKANQLVSSTCDGKVTKYQYDAAGRLVKEGDKSYAYGWLDKVLNVTENGRQIASFDYQVDGQISQAVHGGKTENFLWDDLALIHRGETSFVNEPYVTGGNPILSSKQGVMFNDMLGNTLNVGGKSVSMTAFGETKDADAMFTGKPYIGELGYAFLFRNYRADKGKWLTSDPLGYPDGWNNLAYVNNEPILGMDYLGCENIKPQARYDIFVTSTDVALIGSHTAIVVVDTQTNTPVFSIAGYPANYDAGNSSGSSSALVNPGNLIAVTNADLVVPTNSVRIDSVNDFSNIQNLAAHYNPIVPYSVSSNENGYNCNSFTYNALLYLGYNEDLINNIPNQLDKWQLGWGKRFPSGVLE